MGSAGCEAIGLMGNNPAGRHRFLLLQMRNPADPMIEQEVDCFLDALPCDADQLSVFSLLDGAPPADRIDRADMILLGGSGDHSVAEGGPWMEHVVETMRDLFVRDKPTFASCWGFQAMARAMGGRVITDLNRAELGPIQLWLTDEGRADPVFGVLPDRFLGQAGHQDVVVQLPASAVRLASSDLVENQAFRFRDKPIYCTQFHPELNRARLLQRLRAYPQYVERIAGIPLDEFHQRTAETPLPVQLIRQFQRLFLGTGN
jgi:GMP synthase (glutamine-hydrolysing)